MQHHVIGRGGNPVSRAIPLLAVVLLLAASICGPSTVRAQPRSQDPVPTAAQLIDAVNALRQSRALPPLSVHSVLMQVAEWEVGALADSQGASGHVRPPEMTLGQQLLALGYPLSGDLSLDGYRSENILWGPGTSVQDVVQAWLSDEPHTNTMLSVDRSDIGAAVASNVDEWGSTVHYFVIETALRTNSGQMQYDAYPILTAIAGGQIGSASGAAGALPDQYIVPVLRTTARADGDVLHKVRYGQSLWSIAVAYHTTIEQIRRWNNLGAGTDVYVGQLLLVQKGATQPAPTSVTAQASPQASPAATTPPTTTPSPTASGTAPSAPVAGDREVQGVPSSGILVGVLIVALLGASAAAAFVRMPR